MHTRLAGLARGCYPAAARRFRQKGSVGLRFCADERGVITDSRMLATSGADLLDTAAKTCVLENASPLPIEAASSCFSVRVRFGED
ncbi:MAG: TonB family protein [Archangium sp.]